MSYDSLASGRATSVPFETFAFTYGPGANDVFYYTNSERKISAGGNEYLPKAVSRNEISLKGKADNVDLEVRVPAHSDVAYLFKDEPPPYPVQLTIHEGEFDDATKQLVFLWTGKVLAGTIEGNEMVLRCEQATSGMRRTGLRRHYQINCPYQLYGSQCKANKATATRSTTVSAISGADITLPSGWASGTAAAKFENGMATWLRPDGQREHLSIAKANSETSLTLRRRPRGLSPGDDIDIILGCSHEMSDCSTLHGNIQNFGGQPWIPLENPVGIKNNYY